MALLKPRTRGKQLVRHRTRLDHATNETLYAYAHFLGESTEYVLNQVIDTVLGKDRDFLQWRLDDPASFVPHRQSHVRGHATWPPRATSVTAPASSHCAGHCRTFTRSRTMLRTLLDARTLVAMAVALAVGVWGLGAYPLPADNVYLALIALRRPDVYQGLQYGYATLWFTTPLFAASLIGSLFAIAMYRHAPRLTFRGLPRYVPPEERPAPSLVLGETHHEARPGRASDPQWLIIPQRGLFTGVMVLGSVGTGKTSACIYPCVDQLVRWRSHDADHKLDGLVMKVKDDFCRQVQAMLRACGREAGYVEFGLDTDVC